MRWETSWLASMLSPFNGEGDGAGEGAVGLPFAAPGLATSMAARVDSVNAARRMGNTP
jgi:hypothetical protein